MPEIIADCRRFAAFCCSLISESRYLKHLVLIPLPLARARRAGASRRKLAQPARASAASGDAFPIWWLARLAALVVLISRITPQRGSRAWVVRRGTRRRR